MVGRGRDKIVLAPSVLHTKKGWETRAAAIKKLCLPNALLPDFNLSEGLDREFRSVLNIVFFSFQKRKAMTSKLSLFSQ